MLDCGEAFDWVTTVDPIFTLGLGVGSALVVVLTNSEAVVNPINSSFGIGLGILEVDNFIGPESSYQHLVFQCFLKAT